MRANGAPSAWGYQVFSWAPEHKTQTPSPPKNEFSPPSLQAQKAGTKPWSCDPLLAVFDLRTRRNHNQKNSHRPLVGNMPEPIKRQDDFLVLVPSGSQIKHGLCPSGFAAHAQYWAHVTEGAPATPPGSPCHLLHTERLSESPSNATVFNHSQLKEAGLCAHFLSRH